MPRSDPPADLNASFRSARPFPHIVFDGFLGMTRAEELARAFPDPALLRRAGSTYETEHEHDKVGVAAESAFPEPFRRLKSELHSPSFLLWLGAVTGIPGLVPDPLMLGGGLHRMGGDGKLGIHVDFSEQMVAGHRYYRRLNLLLYLNEGWQKEWGGHLELWEGDRLVHQILPVLDRCAIFETSHESWHGVGPLTAPKPRQSFAVYYYTVSPPDGYRGLIPSTIFRKRPAQA